jgi:hypothetical protein
MFGMSKLRLLGLFAGAVAAFSVVGFAASFQVRGMNEEPRVVNAEGEALVVSCTENVLIDKHDKWLDPVAGEPGSGGFYVDLIILKGIDPACNGSYVAIVLTDKDGKKIAASPWMLKGASNPIWTPAVNIPVNNLHDIHVAIAGNEQDPIN